jgi:CHRD domain
MKRFYFGTALAVTAMLALAGNAISKEDSRGKMKSSLSGFQEVPAVSTTGSGTFRAQLNQAKTGIEFELNHDDLSGAPSKADIHFGQPGVNGGVLANLCGGGSPKPACPATGLVTGTLAVADFLAIVDQGIVGNNLAEALRVIRSGNTYVNVLTVKFPKGEIRGQIRGRSFGHSDDEDDD